MNSLRLSSKLDTGPFQKDKTPITEFKGDYGGTSLSPSRGRKSVTDKDTLQVAAKYQQFHS